MVDKGEVSQGAKVLLLSGQLSLDTVARRLAEAGTKTWDLSALFDIFVIEMTLHTFEKRAI